MAMESAIGEATNATNVIIGVLFRQLKDVRDMGENLEHINTELARMERSLRDIQTQFEDQQKKLPEIVEGCWGRIGKELEKVKDLKARANRQRGLCRGCCLFLSPSIPADIREWKNRFNELFAELDSDLSRAAHTTQIVRSAQPLLQSLTESGFVGFRIEATHQELLTWLNEPHPQGMVIGVCGIGGVSQTAILIWHTIAEHLSLDLQGISSIETRKMELYKSSENRFLLVLDDLPSPINLNEVGVNFGSRVLVFSSERDVVEMMAERDYFMMIRPGSKDEGSEVFEEFEDEEESDEDTESVATECDEVELFEEFEDEEESDEDTESVAAEYDEVELFEEFEDEEESDEDTESVAAECNEVSEFEGGGEDDYQD